MINSSLCMRTFYSPRRETRKNRTQSIDSSTCAKQSWRRFLVCIWKHGRSSFETAFEGIPPPFNRVSPLLRCNEILLSPYQNNIVKAITKMTQASPPLNLVSPCGCHGRPVHIDPTIDQSLVVIATPASIQSVCSTGGFVAHAVPAGGHSIAGWTASINAQSLGPVLNIQAMDSRWPTDPPGKARAAKALASGASTGSI